MNGYLGHQLQKCLEVPNRYILLVRWSKLEDHIIGFRESASYLTWKKLLHHFYDPFPVVEHYSMVTYPGADYVVHKEKSKSLKRRKKLLKSCF
jgi:heme-degrading monooxygenase HmoA